MKSFGKLKGLGEMKRLKELKMLSRSDRWLGLKVVMIKSQSITTTSYIFEYLSQMLKS